MTKLNSVFLFCVLTSFSVFVNLSEIIFSNLLKSNCLVTGQPDWASVDIGTPSPQPSSKMAVSKPDAAGLQIRVDSKEAMPAASRESHDGASLNQAAFLGWGF